MDTYNPDELYAAVAEELFLSRKKAKAAGGRNNIRAKGDGPEKAVRELIGSLMGGQYRVSQGHVVRADGMKSGQMDVIIVRDVPVATMHKAEEGETELVRVEWVAAVGEVKASWANHGDVIRSYRRIVEDMETLQEGRLVENKLRFGTMRSDATIAEMARPVTGRQWNNPCYAFLIALGQGECRVKHLEDDIRENGIKASNASVLILDQHKGATLCIPGRKGRKGVEFGVGAEVRLKSEDAENTMTWVTIQEEEIEASHSSGRFLHYFVTDLQLHLGTWSDEYCNPGHYAKLGPMLRHRHAREKDSGSAEQGRLTV